MGLLDKLKGKKEGAEAREEESAKEASEEEEEEPKYSEQACALCGGTGAERKWAGQFWHKKCYRKMRKVGRGMI